MRSRSTSAISRELSAGAAPLMSFNTPVEPVLLALRMVPMVR